MGRKKKVERRPGFNKDGSPDKRFKPEQQSVALPEANSLPEKKSVSVTDLLRDVSRCTEVMLEFKSRLESMLSILK